MWWCWVCWKIEQWRGPWKNALNLFDGHDAIFCYGIFLKNDIIGQCLLIFTQLGNPMDFCSLLVKIKSLMSVMATWHNLTFQFMLSSPNANLRNLRTTNYLKSNIKTKYCKFNTKTTSFISNTMMNCFKSNTRTTKFKNN